MNGCPLEQRLSSNMATLSWQYCGSQHSGHGQCSVKCLGQPKSLLLFLCAPLPTFCMLCFQQLPPASLFSLPLGYRGHLDKTSRVPKTRGNWHPGAQPSASVWRCEDMKAQLPVSHWHKPWGVIYIPKIPVGSGWGWDCVKAPLHLPSFPPPSCFPHPCQFLPEAAP